ncbi:DUF433 domain-containing protein [Sphingomonas sp. UV9]|uniref:DUF433 domain-containing protein n=1 Tax=Sphingomonas sp. UV9 TaxID=1851410 RepID=UPI000FFBFFA0|nr:DUF433 domain-containing protein [Sphingomonas sp. UV9]RXD01709.1 DUF433 domain-containing protein [Sphingomonas sp. UV9]
MSDAAYGIGIYTAPEAARMVGMRPATLRRWLMGYDHDAKHEDPLWRPQYDPADDDGVLLGFRDLVEARIVNALRAKKIGLPTIRTCMERARDIVGQDRPFSTSQFKTDGKTIFLEITRDLDEPQLIDLKRSQGVFNRVVAPSLADLDFGPDGAERWWLLHGKRTIVADPDRAFGQPIIAEHGMTTARVAEAVEAEGSVAKVAKIYELKPKLIRDALAYEQMLELRRAA